MLRQLVARDGVRLVYYEYSRPVMAASALVSNILFSHATGFHGRVFDRTINQLTGKFNCISMDHRGHGRSGRNMTVPLHWDIFADDVVHVAHGWCGANKVVGVGHSMGAAALLMAALKEPEKFSSLILYEPIIFPFELRLLFSVQTDSPLAKLAKKRRNEFKTHEEAFVNFRKKPPMDKFDESVVKDFVSHGLAPSAVIEATEKEICAETLFNNEPKSNSADESVFLRCDKEFEASIYNTGHRHTTWNDLPKISVPTLIIAGRSDIQQPSFWANRLANRIPNSRFSRWDQNSHFGPLENPEMFASAVENFIRYGTI